MELVDMIEEDYYSNLVGRRSETHIISIYSLPASVQDDDRLGYYCVEIQFLENGERAMYPSGIEWNEELALDYLDSYPEILGRSLDLALVTISLGLHTLLNILDRDGLISVVECLIDTMNNQFQPHVQVEGLVLILL